VRKAASLFGILVLATVILVSAGIGIRPAKADGDYSIEHVFHTVKIMYNGFVFINDTLGLNITEAPSDFLMGFPAEYGQSLLKCIAFDVSDTFPVTLGVPLEGRVGYYGVKIDFPNGAPEVFTVGFVLSSSLLTQNAQNASYYELNFPAYPSLMKKAGVCNASIVASGNIVFQNGTVSGLTYGQENLPELTYLPAQLNFSSVDQIIPIVDITKLSREITPNEFGEIGCTDTYMITNNAPTSLGSFQVFLPSNASNPEAMDQFGTPLASLNRTDATANRYEVTFTSQVASGDFGRFIMKYSLPRDYITQSSNGFTLGFPLFEYENYYVDEAIVTIVLPEGASVKVLGNNSAGDIYGITKDVYQETVTLDRKDIVVLGRTNLEITYEYAPFWASFRPTMWVWAVALVGCVVVGLARQRPKGPTRAPVSSAALRMGPDFFKSFVDAYEEKKKIDLELESLETRAEKGRISRRRYKVMRRTLEARVGVVSRSLTDFKERMRAAGGKYSGLMLQLEVAEAEIGEVKANIKAAESLHSRGELSLEAYRNRLADYQRKKERAEITINGILLRVREETR
jgi:hypothetical protein